MTIKKDIKPQLILSVTQVRILSAIKTDLLSLRELRKTMIDKFQHNYTIRQIQDNITSLINYGYINKRRLNYGVYYWSIERIK